MDKFYGFKGLQVAFFRNESALNKFLKAFDGNIVDIQYQRDDHNIDSVMIVYVKEE